MFRCVQHGALIPYNPAPSRNATGIIPRSRRLRDKVVTTKTATRLKEADGNGRAAHRTRTHRTRAGHRSHQAAVRPLRRHHVRRHAGADGDGGAGGPHHRQRPGTARPGRRHRHPSAGAAEPGAGRGAGHGHRRRSRPAPGQRRHGGRAEGVQPGVLAGRLPAGGAFRGHRPVRTADSHDAGRHARHPRRRDGVHPPAHVLLPVLHAGTAAVLAVAHRREAFAGLGACRHRLRHVAAMAVSVRVRARPGLRRRGRVLRHEHGAVVPRNSVLPAQQAVHLQADVRRHEAGSCDMPRDPLAGLAAVPGAGSQPRVHHRDQQLPGLAGRRSRSRGVLRDQRLRRLPAGHAVPQRHLRPAAHRQLQPWRAPLRPPARAGEGQPGRDVCHLGRRVRAGHRVR